MRTIKIALSASFWNVKACAAVLHLCDRIYSTNVYHFDTLKSLFGAERVLAIPDATPETIDWVKERETRRAKEQDCKVEFVTFGDLYKVSRVYDERVVTAEARVSKLEADLHNLQEHFAKEVDRLVTYAKELEGKLADAQLAVESLEIKLQGANYELDILKGNPANIAVEILTPSLRLHYAELEAALVSKERTIDILMQDVKQLKETGLEQDRRIKDYLGALDDDNKQIDKLHERLATEKQISTNMIEDQRRLNYLAMNGEYLPPRDGAPACTTWCITAPARVDLREQLDRMRKGLEYNVDNRPISPHGGSGWSPMAKKAAALIQTIITGGDPQPIDDRISSDAPATPEEDLTLHEGNVRDPMEQNHLAADVVEIETCERMMDYREVPEFKDGEFVKMVRAPKYHAQIRDEPGFWGCGVTIPDAIGSLIENHPEHFRVHLVFVGRKTR